MQLSNFFNSDFVDYASYDNLRKIGSCIDGLKNASRKVIFTVLEKNIKEPIKVSQLANKVAEYAEYLHGSLDGVVVNLGQDFAGTNNVPLLQKKGNFGTRFAQEASAPRYIFTYGSKNLFTLFKKEDLKILKEQMFEGERIEPVFYVPTLPLILVNGSEGVSSGFAQKILPRNPKNIIKYLTNKIQGKRNNKDLLKPFFNDFKGTVEQGETSFQWLIKGKIERTNKNQITISEIPVGYDLKTYIKVLKTLEDSKVILDWDDLSDKEFKFIVKMNPKDLDKLSEDEILDKLKLVKKVTENLTCLNANNQIQEFQSAEEILDYYFKVKMEYLGKRKDYLVQELKTDLDILNAKITFIKAILDKSLVIEKQPKDKIVKNLEKIITVKVQDSYDYLLNMPLYSLTLEKIKALTETLKNSKLKLKETQEKTLENFWLEDLEEI